MTLKSLVDQSLTDNTGSGQSLRTAGPLALDHSNAAIVSSKNWEAASRTTGAPARPTGLRAANAARFDARETVAASRYFRTKF